jgi:hypothetical protein
VSHEHESIDHLDPGEPEQLLDEDQAERVRAYIQEHAWWLPAKSYRDGEAGRWRRG